MASQSTAGQGSLTQHKGYVLIIVDAICFPLLLFFVGLRSYVRIWATRSIAWDDAACLLATIGAIAYGSVLLDSVYVAGEPLRDLPISTFNTKFFKLTIGFPTKELIFVYGMTYGPTVFFAKASIFLLYLRIFSPDRVTKYLIYFGIIITFLYYFATALLIISWIPKDINNETSWLITLGNSAQFRKNIINGVHQGIFNVVSDLYVLILPIPAVWKLQLPWRKKIGICIVFATGLGACIASSIGCYFRFLLYYDLDWTGHLNGLGSTTVLEMTFGIICGCMPYLAPTLKRWRQKAPTFVSLYSMFRFGRRSGRSGRSDKILNSIEVEPESPSGLSDASRERNRKHYLETKILGSVVQGEGKFLGTFGTQNASNGRQREWLDRERLSAREGSQAVVPEDWNV